jgi:hypothetical protein
LDGGFDRSLGMDRHRPLGGRFCRSFNMGRHRLLDGGFDRSLGMDRHRPFDGRFCRSFDMGLYRFWDGGYDWSFDGSLFRRGSRRRRNDASQNRQEIVLPHLFQLERILFPRILLGGFWI